MGGAGSDVQFPTAPPFKKFIGHRTRAGLPSLTMHAPHQPLLDAVRAAAAAGRTLRLRGGGTKDFWGAPPQGEVLDTRICQGIISYEPSELVVTARCGTPLAELEAVLAEKGQCLAFEPPHFGPGATVGGMVAAGLSGPARASVGAVRDFVLGVRCINGRGEDLTFGGQVMKNVAGYDVSRLLAGSWGTLALITEVSLKVLPVAPAEATLMCAGIGQKDALGLLHRWGGQPLPLNASAWVHDTTANPGDDYLFVRLRGAVAAVESAVTRMGADAQALGAQVLRMDNAEASKDWRASGEQTLQFFTPPRDDLCLWRLSVPQTAPVIDLPYPQYIEWQGAQRWLWAPATAAGELHPTAQRVGGHATLFRASQLGGASDKAVGVHAALDPVQQRIQRALQQQFDPQGVLATGRMGI